MKLLLDDNISHRVLPAVIDLFPDSTHVRLMGMQQATDEQIWTVAKQQSLVIVSKDDDFHQRSFLYGAPPKVVWLRLGNCSTQEILDCLRKRVDDLLAFDADPLASFLAMS